MSKKPRLDRYYALICRFYEALYMLCILGKVRGPHLLATPDFSNIRDIRRRFLRNLAFLCDFAKGGLSTTSLAVQNRHDCNVFWMASNQGPQESTLEFLSAVIRAVQESRHVSTRDKAKAQENLTHKCIDFAARRVKNQARGLSSTVEKCQQYVRMEKSIQCGPAGLASWLQRLQALTGNQDLRAVCQGAYQCRNDAEVDRLLRLSREPGVAALAFRKARHAIGRLAAYIRAAKQVLEDGWQLDDLLDVFTVAAVPQPSCVPRPQADGHTTLHGVLKRMLRAEDPRLSGLLDYLSGLEGQGGFEERLLDQYDARREPPCVHAEIQMLHHFYDGDLDFFANDPYIAISKPACLCCKLYFRHHPAGSIYEELDSHEKVCHNWSPIFLLGGRDDPGWIGQRDALNEVAKDLRKEVFREIKRRRTLSLPRSQHPDTLTGFTTGSQGTLGDDSESSEEDSFTDVSDAYDSDYDTGSEGGAEL